jgi:hypothetical protein
MVLSPPVSKHRVALRTSSIPCETYEPSGPVPANSGLPSLPIRQFRINDSYILSVGLGHASAEAASEHPSAVSKTSCKRSLAHIECLHE